MWTGNELQGILSKVKVQALSNLRFSLFFCRAQSQRENFIQSRTSEEACLCPDCDNVGLMADSICKTCEKIGIPSKCHNVTDKIAHNRLSSHDFQKI